MSTLVSRDMRTHRLSLLGAVVVVVAAVSGGCGGYGGGSKTGSTYSSTSSSSSSGGAVIKTVTVHETEYKLNPNTISLAKTGTYSFKDVNDQKECGSGTRSVTLVTMPGFVPQVTCGAICSARSSTVMSNLAPSSLRNCFQRSTAS